MSVLGYAVMIRKRYRWEPTLRGNEPTPEAEEDFCPYLVTQTEALEGLEVARRSFPRSNFKLVEVREVEV